MKKTAFTLVEIIIVVTIIAIGTVASYSAFSLYLTKAEFDGMVTDTVSVFQTARSYASKSVAIDGNFYDSFKITFNAGDDYIKLSGIAGVTADELLRLEFEDVVTSPNNGWSILYEVPYAHAMTSTGNDLSIVLTGLKGEHEKTIVVHNLSGIAELMD